MATGTGSHLHRVRRGFLALGFGLAALLFAVSTATAEDVNAPVDPTIAAALQLLTDSPSAGHIVPVLQSNHVAVVFASMAPGTYAHYIVSRHVIEIDSQWQNVDSVTLAAVLAHEGTHAEDAVDGYLSSGGASSCIGSEIRAFRTSAQFWTEQYGTAGKPAPADELERQMNLVAQRQAQDPSGLEALVRQAYVDQCGSTGQPS